MRAMPAKGMCGTPGCTRKDYHVGLCNIVGLTVSSKRPRVQVLEPVQPSAPEPSAPSIRRMRRPRPAPDQFAAVPAQQELLPSGLHKFYHAARWGVPLPDGPVLDNYANDKVDEEWRLSQDRQRIAGRTGVSASQLKFMSIWNSHVHNLPPLVSDRMLPEACRVFADEHAELLAAELLQPFVLHLLTLGEHNLLHRADIEDCLLITARATLASEAASTLCSECTRPLHEETCALARRPRGIASLNLRSSNAPTA